MVDTKEAPAHILKRIGPTQLILLVCVAALLATAAVSFFAFEQLPHLEDEVAYLFQAKTLALGRLTVPSPEYPEPFWTPFVLDHEGRRFGKYPPGWPAVLAGGVVAGAPWLVNPILAALALYLVYRLGREWYDGWTGLLAAAFGLLSPLFLILSGSFLSHLASLVWLLLFSLWFIWTARGRHPVYAIGAGLALGAAFLTRSLTAVAYAVPFVLYSLYQVVTRRQPHWRRYLLVAAAGGALAALLPVYQWAVTGDPWLNPYVLWWPYDRIGFGPGIGAMPGGHSPFYAWVNLKQDLSRAATDLLGWPALEALARLGWPSDAGLRLLLGLTIGWLPLLLGLALHPRRARDWALAAPFACLVVAYLFYWIGSPARLWGPRYYFEGFGGLWLLAAVGVRKAWVWASAQERPAWLRPALAATLAVVTAVSLSVSLPPRLAEAHAFYGITRAQFEPIEEAELENALVIVYAKRWLEYGALLASMSPLLDDEVYYLYNGELSRTPP
ncbi:MAG: glycosyltransferase family 39 protein [Anaerolineae bacterium]|jgi:4-amino-4-deoxy-L-arabinose transferase-like glycosyltransferase